MPLPATPKDRFSYPRYYGEHPGIHVRRPTKFRYALATPSPSCA